MKTSNSIAQQLSKLLSFVALLIISAQVALITLRGEAYCLNEGCKIVERLTRVSPLIFNLAGLFFFLTLFVVILKAKNYASPWAQASRLLLLAGLGAEGVLMSFQHLIAKTWCSYCLIILSFVIALNLLAGFKQTLRGIFVFSAIVVAFFSLDFNKSSSPPSLAQGVLATQEGLTKSPALHLFFSSTCKHCEKVIETIRKNPAISIAFNPIDEMKTVDVPGLHFQGSYSAAANRTMLKIMGIDEIPVLLVKKKDRITFIQGEKAIQKFLQIGEASQTLPQQKETDFSGYSNQSEQQRIPGLDEPNDGCSVATDCVDGAELVPPGSAP